MKSQNECWNPEVEMNLCSEARCWYEKKLIAWTIEHVLLQKGLQKTFPFGVVSYP